MHCAFQRWPFSIQLAVPRRYKKDMLAGVKVLGAQGESVSRSSPEMRLALSALLVISAWARLRSLFLILVLIVSQPNLGVIDFRNEVVIREDKLRYCSFAHRTSSVHELWLKTQADRHRYNTLFSCISWTRAGILELSLFVHFFFLYNGETQAGGTWRQD